MSQQTRYGQANTSNTGVASIVSIYGLTSLIIHNRRQKRAWIEREMQRLTDAQKAFLGGTATPEQLHLLQQERAGEEMALQRERQKQVDKSNSWWNRGKRLLLGETEAELAQEERERRYGRQGRTAAGAGTAVDQNEGAQRLLEEGWVENENGATQSVGEIVMEKVNSTRREGESVLEQVAHHRGGMLDAMADNIASAVTSNFSSGGRWWSRGSGSGS